MEFLSCVTMQPERHSDSGIQAHSLKVANSEIARRVFVTRQTMNTLLRGLEQRDLVERADQAQTGRAIPTTLTKSGERLLAQATARIDEINQVLTNALEPHQRIALALALTKCREALEDTTLDPTG